MSQTIDPNQVFRIGKARVKVPLDELIAAGIAAGKAAAAEAADDRDTDSDGGRKVTAKEIGEDISAFLETFVREASTRLLAANGISHAAGD